MIKKSEYKVPSGPSGWMKQKGHCPLVFKKMEAFYYR